MEKEVAIKIENLGKKYVIGKRGEGLKYLAFRDSISNFIKLPYKLVTGKISFKKPHIWALKNVSFEVKKGEVIGIIGRNGAGKTTLLKILSRITEPTTGRITINGRVASLLEIGTGFHPELTGRENIYLNGAILGMKKKEIDAKFNDIVEFSGVEKFLDTPVKKYSSGMQVRLGFAVAAHLEPEILLVDEVLAVGDAEFQKKCLGKMRDVATGGRTVLFVSHNMAAIENLCQKVILLDKGKIMGVSNPKRMISKYIESSKALTSMPIRDRKDRKGSGKIKITNVEMLNENFEKINSLITGKEAIIAIDYESQEKKTLNNIDFSVSLKDNMGRPLSLLMTSYAQGYFNGLKPKGRVYCKIQKVPLTAGVYYANVNVSIFDEIVDWIFDAFTIEVVEGDFYGTGKLTSGSHSPFLISHVWGKWEENKKRKI